jgi:hypothetical protein
VNGSFGVWEEIQREQRGDAAVPLRVAWQASNTRGNEGHPDIATMLSREFDEGGGWIAAYDRRRVGVVADRVGQGSRSTPNI